MQRPKRFLAFLVLPLALSLAAACAPEATPDAGAPAPANEGVVTTIGGVGAPTGVMPGGVGVPVASTTASFSEGRASVYPVIAPSGSGQTGIWVSGTGTVTAEPDLAVLTLGVEARAESVEEARDQAASAMTGVLESLGNNGVASNDIQTSFFNISPQYTWREQVDSKGGRYSEQVLIGYQVTNQATVRLRDLEKVGDVVDDAVRAGGDLIRVRGVRFTIDDPSALHTLARELAVKDAMTKASQFADLTGVAMGGLVYITELGGTPVVQTFDARAEGVALASAASTPVSSGELEVQVSIQAVFGIQ